MSIFLLGAAPSSRADAHADCGKLIPDSERRLPSAIAGADIPNDTVLQIKSVVLNSTLVYGIEGPNFLCVSSAPPPRAVISSLIRSALLCPF